jgi:hypothetical protein
VARGTVTLPTESLSDVLRKVVGKVMEKIISHGFGFRMSRHKGSQLASKAGRPVAVITS